VSPLNGLKTALMRLFYRAANWLAWRKHPAPGLSVESRTIAGPTSNIPIRIYRPDNTPQPSCLIVYYHGGGWVIGDLKTHDPFCRQLSAANNALVIAVDYRRAPEHPFPAAADDSLAATRWVIANRDQLAPGTAPLFVAGDSAGGNLAAVCARELGEALAGQILIYPVTQHYRRESASYDENGKGYGLTRDLMMWFWDSYLLDTDLDQMEQPEHELATPAHWEKVTGLPPAIVLTAELDPLRDEGIAFAKRLQDENVDCQMTLYDKAQHGFLCSEGPSEHHLRGMREISKWILKHSKLS
jgi:acetyl esterase